MAVTWPLTRFANIAIHLAGAAWALYLSTFDNGTLIDEDTEWRRLQIVFDRSGDDKAVCSFDLLNFTSSSPDPTWTSTDYEECEARFSTFLTAYKPYMAPGTTAVQYRWYKMRFRPLSDTKPFAPSILPDRLTTISIVGTGNIFLYPRQMSHVITEKTALPKHWGRVYLPMDGGTSGLVAKGEVSTSDLNVIGTAAEALYEGLWTDDFAPVVPVTQIDKDPARGLLTVQELVHDSVPDIQRRRRISPPTVKQARILA